MRCEVADESVVVMKSRPMKAGNRLEDKTGTTRRTCRRGPLCAKSRGGMRREDVYSKVCGNWFAYQSGHKLPDGAGHAISGRL